MDWVCKIQKINMIASLGMVKYNKYKYFNGHNIGWVNINRLFVTVNVSYYNYF